MQNKVSVIIPIFNRLDYTKITLPQIIHECLKNVDLIDKIFIYDDMSIDGTGEFVQKIVDRFKGKLPIVHKRTKIGNSVYQINNSYKNTDAKYLVKIDNDIIIPPGYIKTLHTEMEENNKIGFLMMPEVAEFPFINEHYQINKRAHIGGVGIFRKEIFDKLGDIPSEKTYFGFTGYQYRAQRELGVICCQILGTGNTNLDASPIYSRVMEYERNGWGRNLWKGVKSIVDKY